MNKDNLKDKVKEVFTALEGLTYMQWQVIEREVNNEYKRLANKNTLVSRECFTKNVIDESDLHSVTNEYNKKIIDVHPHGDSINQNTVQQRKVSDTN
ncbi:hypothetical protein P4U05_17110 [Bacillus paranthracis]|uniref:hypothetical protein n=1 Tax=Bacillus phage phi4B1 TaxID=1643324 RepID=UPI000200F29F|nr:hypothetical protein [Bacillus paranthracis]YP_009206332.1 hypothetical protein XO26_0033 [Bacillus phage phi4B1]ADY20324.1 hypothetical protein YBT020_05390 [Bacillus thuringiensis serovar finitimus YBT-020]MRC72820.1 hypothetical protein [Bacillus thuringiensis]OTX71274.1 hypothetical protein BK722_12740 [Bacillus thuringiensis serovar finitimus]PGZ45729.1 hypothetical protein COE56_25955 [Bacillus anthracis]ALF02593.1 hypothetical protein XO26_0033 [Bacillus phage phi4B1]